MVYFPLFFSLVSVCMCVYVLCINVCRRQKKWPPQWNSKKKIILLSFYSFIPYSSNKEFFNKMWILIKVNVHNPWWYYIWWDGIALYSISCVILLNTDMFLSLLIRYFKILFYYLVRLWPWCGRSSYIHVIYMKSFYNRKEYRKKLDEMD